MVRRNLTMPLADYVFNDGFVGGALIGTMRMWTPF